MAVEDYWGDEVIFEMYSLQEWMDGRMDVLLVISKM